ncbi:3-methyl-2-oxobutanoate hydroxymethyltransferase [Virgibacillus halodenitrificans]|jgi:3-methyl-2-oxobutanoate hydroxymethyltransferase|uniref:3-methyl-2-oxobutanoate hydroxymethyltransferase n=1 Tax=Virgibacillus halodenitrificans TaxID=1482 RepID=UPI0007620CD5|nr:3-methyl-2-oxobutanoate hydroxymethyltransferase [Virgibacillus halodenitrificans]MYL45284.1 3-methyl-2-oxobutanoate hydroxymethyltransferase [Virgibacillus halodenitrificans]MYL57867.1 3-methyl-2-oxobutanoate hydroxymethyltransferase [Virgibacillus halodenitrificans]
MLNRIDLLKMKETKEKITMLTAYDYPSAKLAEQAGIDMILVGDSLGMVVLGYNSTIQVTVEDMIHHGKAVQRGASNTFIVVDMPFMSYHISMEESMKNAQRIFQETGAQAIKLEGASKDNLDLIKRLSEAGVPVIAHLGLTPQSVNVLGGYKVQGKDADAAAKLLYEAKEVSTHGAIALVLECVPKELAELITEAINIPTIGIGAGAHCDGQVLVYHDIVNYGVDRLPKFVNKYGDFNSHGQQAIETYIRDVKESIFPGDKHSFFIKDKNILPEN